jgi:tetratricopeptide (TPR) repeat protein
MRQPDTVVSTRQDLLVLTTGLLGYCIIQYFDFPRERIEMQVVLAILLAGIVFHTRDLWTQLPGIPIGKFKNLFSGIVAAGLLFNLVSGWYRVKGETHAVRMVREQAKRNYQGVIAEAQAAESRFYEYNDVAVPFAWYEGIAYYQMGRMEQAVTAFERAYRLNPWSFQVINNYASALVKAGRYTEAVPLYEKVMAINPRYEDGKFNLAYTWYQAGNAQKALEWLDRVDTIPNPATEEQRRENAATRKRQDDFRKVIGSK